jgi:hypothetical protein
MAGQVKYPVSTYAPRFTQPNMGRSAGAGLGGLIGAIAGPPKMNQPEVNTGVDAQGNPTFDITPASIGGGFFNRLLAGKQGRQQVDGINGQLQIAKLNALGELANTRTQGEQSRKTHITDAQIAMLQSMGLMPKTTPDGSSISADLINAVAAKTEQPNLDAAGYKANANRSIAKTGMEVTDSPMGQDAIGESTIGQLMMPAFQAQKASQVSAAPGETVAYNRPDNLMADRPDLLRGATSSSQQFTPMQVPTRDASGKVNGFEVKTFPTATSGMQPGGLQQQIPSDILQDASQQVDPNANLMAPPPAPDPNMGNGLPQVEPMPGMAPPMSTNSNVPNKPLMTMSPGPQINWDVLKQFLANQMQGPSMLGRGIQ